MLLLWNTLIPLNANTCILVSTFSTGTWFGLKHHQNWGPCVCVLWKIPSVQYRCILPPSVCVGLVVVHSFFEEVTATIEVCDHYIALSHGQYLGSFLFFHLCICSEIYRAFGMFAPFFLLHSSSCKLVMQWFCCYFEIGSFFLPKYKFTCIWISFCQVSHFGSKNLLLTIILHIILPHFSGNINKMC